MGIPMVKCALCGADVTKRQSMLVEPYGRICRSHPEVEAYTAKLEAERQRIRDSKADNMAMAEAMRRLHIMSTVAAIRTIAFMQGIPLHTVAGLIINRVAKDAQDEVLTMLDEKGELTQEEFLGSLIVGAKLGITK